MTTHFDRDYFSYRAEEERALVGASGDPRAAAVHAQLADRYALLASEFSDETPRLTLVE